jgi:hypothetical protein
MTDAAALPPQQDLSSEHVIQALSRYGLQRILVTSIPQIMVLSVMGRLMLFWVLAFIGNFVGTLVIV